MRARLASGTVSGHQAQEYAPSFSLRVSDMHKVMATLRSFIYIRFVPYGTALKGGRVNRIYINCNEQLPVHHTRILSVLVCYSKTCI